MWLRNNLANLLTLGNLLCGVLACLVAGELFEYTQAPLVLGGNWLKLTLTGTFVDVVLYLVCLGALLDFLDGAVARALRAKSPLGEQLDSLADIVTFGVAPALLLFRLLRHEQLPDVAWLALLLPLFSAWRLARFNSSPAGHGSTFQGLPTPANGIYICALCMAIGSEFNALQLQPWELAVLILLQCFLLVSNVPFLSLKGGCKTPLISLGVFVLLSILLGGWKAVPIVMFMYLFASMAVRMNWYHRRWGA